MITCPSAIAFSAYKAAATEVTEFLFRQSFDVSKMPLGVCLYVLCIDTDLG